VIGEAARQLSSEFKEAHPGIPWATIVDMRHRLVHEYFRINPAEVWLVVARDLPDLMPKFAALAQPGEHP
jgi:uncharacterized protein with HEPN domain